MTETQLKIIEFVVLLLGGGALGKLADKWVTGGDARLADGAHVRGELWTRLRQMEGTIAELQNKVQAEHDARVKLEALLDAFVRGYEDFRKTTLRMIRMQRDGDAGWEVVAVDLEGALSARDLLRSIREGDGQEQEAHEPST